jgi:predicted transcriptional regulator
MSSRRSKFEILVDILTQIKKGVSLPTRIMYSTNLSWKPLNQMLESLVSQGLVEEFSEHGEDKRSRKTYRITEKGDTVLGYFSQAKDLLDLESTSSSIEVELPRR